MNVKKVLIILASVATGFAAFYAICIAICSKLYGEDLYDFDAGFFDESF